jgi:hypothetical protein
MPLEFGLLALIVSTGMFGSSVSIRPRIYIGKNIARGPGKIDLLETVDKTRSTSAAG